MSSKRKQHSAKYKFAVALEAVKGQETINQIGSKFGVHPSQVSQWKRQLMDGGVGIFESPRPKKERVQGVKEEEFYEQIGRLKMELEWVKKKVSIFN